MLSTVHEPSLQKRFNDFVDSKCTFFASDLSLPHKPTDAKPCPSSPIDTVIDKLAAFLDVLARKKGFRMASQLIRFFQKTDVYITVFCENLRNTSYCSKVIPKQCESMIQNSGFQETKV